MVYDDRDLDADTGEANKISEQLTRTRPSGYPKIINPMSGVNSLFLLKILSQSSKANFFSK